MNKACDLLWEDIHVDDEITFSRLWTEQDIATFACLSKDYNPLHVDESYASTTRFEKKVVHGMLVASMLSEGVGMYLPGKKCLLLRESITFKKPVFVSDQVAACLRVKKKSDATKIITLEIIFTRNEEIVASGEVLTQLL